MRKKIYTTAFFLLLILSLTMVACNDVGAILDGAIVKPSEAVHTVKFDSNGGSSVASVQVAEGARVAEPEQPTRTQYVFSGWYKDLSFENAWDFDLDVVNRDITLYAKWIQNIVTLAKNIKEAGTVSKDNQNVVGSSTTITAETNEGYTFIGWYDGTIKLTDELSYTFIMPAESKTYTAKWCKINTTKNIEEAGTISILDKSYRVGDLVTITATTGIGYAFIGWYDGETKLTDMPDYTFRMPAENKIYTAKWCELSTAKNIDKAGTVNNFDSAYCVGDKVTITATTYIGYTYIGWYDGETKLTDALSYTVTVPAENKTYTAKWCKISTAKNVDEGGTISGLNSTYFPGDEVTITATTNAGYAFTGWYDGETKLADGLSYTFEMPAESKTYTAKWYKISSTAKNIDEAGSVSELESAYRVGDEVTITATTNKGYTFIGWYDGATKLTDELSYTFTMPEGCKTYMAKWCKVSVAKNINTAGAVSELESAYRVGDEVTITAMTNIGYTFIGWYDKKTKLSDDLSYTFTMPAEDKTYTARWILNPITLEVNITEAGTVSKEERTIVGKSTTITAKASKGYIFVGWYDGETELSGESNYTFAMLEENKTYTAKFKLCIEHMFDEDCVCTQCGKTVHTPGEDCVCIKCKKIAHTPGEDCVCIKCKKIAHAPGEDCVCTQCGAISHTFNEDCVCTQCGAEVHMTNIYCRHDKVVYFGQYPQGEVTDSELKESLTLRAGSLPSEKSTAQWTSYGYYVSGGVNHFMWYLDVEYENEKYRGVYFTDYRPYYTTYSNTSTNSSYQDDNGYYTNTVYWFKYEPIKWQILTESDGKAFLLADIAIDSQNYYITSSGSARTINGSTVYENNYAYSTIRTWLNETFYNTAFDALQKEMIQTIEVDNNVASTGCYYSQYECSNTIDKVFLLSYKEATTYLASDTERMCKSTDYAKSQGCFEDSTENEGNCWWWLRSYCYNRSDCVRTFRNDGSTGDNRCVNCTYGGIIPALWIVYEEPDNAN